mgnify:CR=1 FL=1|tara:strand:- start:232 stop:594 length:363 start_codon:yes stop_codon:yes gene_type:complete
MKMTEQKIIARLMDTARELGRGDLCSDLAEFKFKLILIQYSKSLDEERDSSPLIKEFCDEFNIALKLLRYLADIQDGVPPLAVEDEYNEIMYRVYEFLSKNEIGGENSTYTINNPPSTTN